MTPVKVIQDYKQKWYVIPNDLLSEFKELNYKASIDKLYESSVEFENKFERFETELNKEQLYVE